MLLDAILNDLLLHILVFAYFIYYSPVFGMILNVCKKRSRKVCCVYLYIYYAYVSVCLFVSVYIYIYILTNFRILLILSHVYMCVCQGFRGWYILRFMRGKASGRGT